MPYKWLLMIVYGLIVIRTGLMRSVEAAAFKPNAFWFCMITGLFAVAAGYLLRLEKRLAGMLLGMLAVVPVLGFYLWCFTTQPEKDANERVATAIVASIAAICVLTLPGREKPS